MMHTFTFVPRDSRVDNNMRTFPVAIDHKSSRNNENDVYNVKDLNQICSLDNKSNFYCKKQQKCVKISICPDVMLIDVM